MLSSFKWSKVTNFFQLGGEDLDDNEEYQSILDPSLPYMNDEMIESHNVSSSGNGGHGGLITGAGSASRASSMVVHFDHHHKHSTSSKKHNNTNNTHSLGSNSNDRESTSTFDDSRSSSSSGTSTSNELTSEDYEDSLERLDNIDGKKPPLLGMLLVTLSAVCYAALNLSVKALMDQTPWQELMIIRMGVTWAATMVWILVQYRGQMSLFGPKDKRLLLTWRAFFLWGAMFCCWWSFEFLPVGMFVCLICLCFLFVFVCVCVCVCVCLFGIDFAYACVF